MIGICPLVFVPVGYNLRTAHVIIQFTVDMCIVHYNAKPEYNCDQVYGSRVRMSCISDVPSAITKCSLSLSRKPGKHMASFPFKGSRPMR